MDRSGIMTRRAITTDELVKQMFSWIKESKSYVDKVRELAEELEPSIMNKVCTEQQQAKKTLEDLIEGANDKDEQSKDILEEIKNLLNELKEMKINEVNANEMKEVKEMKEMKEMEEEKTNEVDQRVMYEVLRAMVKRSGPEMNPEQTQSLDKFIDEYLKGFFSGGLTDSFDKSLLTSLSVILVFFGLIFSGTKSKLLFDEGLDQLKQAAPSAGVKACLKGGGMAKGGAVGIVYSLPDGIYNQTDLMKKDYVTGARISLRVTADGIEEITETVRKLLHDIETILTNRIIDQLNETTGKRILEQSNVSGTIRVGLLNVHSLNKTLKGKNTEDKRWIPEEVKKLIEQNNLDVFLTTETWLKEEDGDNVLEEASPPNYKFFHSVRQTKGGGVAIQYKEGRNGKRKIAKNSNPKTFEYVAAELRHAKWNEPVLFINVYRSSGPSPGVTIAEIEAFLREFKELLDELSVGYNRIIITGDFNIHVDVDRETTTTMFEEFLDDNGLTQHVKGPTHDKGHTLDLVITRNVEISDLRVQDDEISDHYSVYFNAMPGGPTEREE